MLLHVLVVMNCKLQIVFIYLWSSGCFPSVKPFIASIREEWAERAERAILMEELLTPVWNTDVKISSTEFTGGQMGSWFLLRQNLIYFLNNGWYFLRACGRQHFVRISADSSDFFQLITFSLILCMQGLIGSISSNFHWVLQELVDS